MHEILPTKIATSVRRYGAKALPWMSGKKLELRQGKAMTKEFMTLAVAMASLPAIALAQDARPQAPSYCFDLTRVVDLAMTKERFASIAGRPRQGSFQDTRLVLPDWKDCSLYGAATYTC